MYFLSATTFKSGSDTSCTYKKLFSKDSIENTKPSSSDHSAQLLSLSGKTINGFIGFDGLEKEKVSYVPVTGQQISESNDHCVDSDFRMVMRKMLKRDAVTRLKALQEFKEYCTDKDVDAVRNVIPFWPRLFNRLALDTDRRIREATHLANGELILKIKRDIAPYLKSIMGVWLLGQSDLYAPAASAAQTTFSSTFPTAKQSDALMHCKQEIFAYYQDNLFEQTMKSLSEPNSSSPEDMENKYILVISGTLQAFKLFLTVVHPSDHKNLKDSFYSMVADKRFWKFAKSKETLIRGSWYALIGSLCQSMQNVFEGMENKLATTIFSSLSESDPTVAPSVWEAALSVVVNFKNCWKGININKVVLPQLWSLLKQGGKGNAQILFPCLLPFLSKLPEEVIEDENTMLQFFSNLRQSLFLENVKVSHMECDAILTAFVECLQYICCVRIVDSKISSTLLEKVLLNEVIQVIDLSLYSKNSHLGASKLYPLLGSLLCKIEYKCQHGKDSEMFSKTLITFWEHLFPSIQNVFTLKTEEKANTVMLLSYFFNSLVVSSQMLIKTEKSKVRFEDEASSSDSVIQNECSTNRTFDPYSVILSNETSQSFPFILKFTTLLCANIIKDCDLYYLNLLIEILESAQNENILFKLLTSPTTKNTQEGLSLNFFNEFIHKCLVHAKNDTAKLNCIAELIFIVGSNISEDEISKMLITCSEMRNVTLLLCLLSKGLMKYGDVSFFQEWVKNPSFCSNIVMDFGECLNTVLHSDSFESNEAKQYLNLITICLKSKLIEKSFLDNKNMEDILLSLKYFSDMLFRTDSVNANLNESVELLVDFVTSILKNSKACWNFKALEELICVIFHQSLKSYDYIQPLRNIWVTAIQSYILVKSEIVHDSSLILRLATNLHTSILNLKTFKESMHILDHCLHLLSSVQESLILQKSRLQYSALFALYKLMDSILPTDQDWHRLKDGFNFSTVPLFLKKELFYPLFVEESFFPSGSIHEVILTVFVIFKILSNELNKNNCLTDKKFSESFVTKHFPHILWFGTFFEETSAVNVLEGELLDIKISQDCFEMLKFLPNGVTDIVSEIFELSLIHGTYWAIPLQVFVQQYEQSQSQKIPLLIEDLLWKENLEENLNKYVLQQMVIPYISTERQKAQLEIRLLELSLMRDLHDENYAGKLGEVCCYLQNSNIVLTKEMQSMLSEILCCVIEFDFANENLKFAYSLQISAVLDAIVKYGLDNFNPDILDYFVTTLKIFLEKCFSMELQNPTVSLELNQIFEIFSALSCMNQDGIKCKNKDKLLSFDEDDFSNLTSLYLYAANAYNEFKPLPEICHSILLSVSDAMKFLSPESLVKIIDDVTRIPRLDDSTVLHSLVSSLTFNIPQIQFTSHSMLMKIMRILPRDLPDSEITQIEEDTEEDTPRLPQCLSPLIKLLTFLTEIVESMLSDFKIGDLCSVLPQTDAYVYTMAYLLSWIEMLEFISSSPSQVRLLYAANLEETKLLSLLFSNVFRLMPSNPVTCLKNRVNVGTPKKENVKVLFTQPPVMSSGVPSSEDIQTMACYVYATVLRKVPATIRTWWNNLDRKSSDIVNQFTSKYVSGLLCIEEIQAVHDSEKQFENMVIQIRPGSREVTATYTIDEKAIELSVLLPVNYPLGPMSAERRGKVVIGQLEWKHWLMQLTSVLRYQNGSILDGLNIWKRNLDKKFEGIEECMICFYIVHYDTLKLPKLSCRVCKKKFHKDCLYKWFKTGNKTTCPLCRNEFFIY